MILSNRMCLHILHFTNMLESVLHLSIFKKIKIICIKRLILEQDYIDNNISNLVCTKPDQYNKCDKALYKLRESQKNIFRISPRAIVVCVLNNNIEMLHSIRDLGYPLEMITCASNYHLIKKRNLENFISTI